MATVPERFLVLEWITMQVVSAFIDGFLKKIFLAVKKKKTCLRFLDVHVGMKS